MHVSRRSAALACALVAACVAPTDQNQVTPPLSMSVVSGNGQQGAGGTELPDPLVVRVEDARGRPVSGQIVNFRVVSGGGSVFAGAAISNRNGLVQERWTLGFGTPQQVEARAIDPATGAPLTFAVFTATLTDSSPPFTFGVNAFPNPAAPGDSVIVTAVVSDTFSGGSNIAGADVQVDSGPFLAMSAGDGAFDQQNEFVIRTLFGLALGSHSICVRGRDAAGNIGFPDCTFLFVTNGGGGGDSIPPITSNVLAIPNPSNPGDSVTIRAQVSDTFTGGSNIAGADVQVDSGGPLLMMNASDGAFDQENELVFRTLVGLSAGSHLVCVRGRDSAGNTGSFACIVVTVGTGSSGDTVGPVTLNVSATPDSVAPHDSIRIRAEVRDTFTGGSNIAGAEMNVDSTGFVPMFATDGAFNQQNERVNRLVVGLAVGSHSVCVRGRDTAGNTGNQTCIGFSVAATSPVPESPRRGRQQR
jgi:hypothetical protein